MVDQQSSTPTTRKVVFKALPLPEAITVGSFAEKMGAEPIQVIKQLMRAGVFASVNEVVDYETAAGIARQFGFAARPLEVVAKAASGGLGEEDDQDLEPRAPIVTILGHVDHGKTSLLDAIRQTDVVKGEAGGITQHIGAYQVEHNGNPITFIDTPGHEAFTAMRARGAQVTDVAVLVVAADDGVMPQTAEAIDHIKAAAVPIIVAINKIDVDNADPERVRRQLSERGLQVEKWGGDIVDVEVSAKTGQGLGELLESIQVVAEVAELKANPERAALGVVIEAKVDRGRGPVATVLVQTGTLKVGDAVVVGTAKGRVRALIDYQGARLREAGPSMPVEVLGFDDLPTAGDRVIVVADDRAARDVIEKRQRLAQGRSDSTLQELGSRAASGSEGLNLVLKTDVYGSVDAVRQSVEQLSTDETLVRVIHAAPGTVTESDVLLAKASKALIISFNTRIEPGAKRLAQQDRVEVRNYSIIYRLIEDVELAVKGLAAPVLRDVVEGTLEIRAIFGLSRGHNSAGCYVSDGQVSRGSMARVMRGDKELFDGPISSLRRFKDDVRQVAQGYECGIILDGFDDFQEGDKIEAHRQVTS